MDQEEIERRKKAYTAWREAHRWPQFEPPSGICWKCKKQIFELLDGTEAISGCPHCHRSFVD